MTQQFNTDNLKKWVPVFLVKAQFSQSEINRDKALNDAARAMVLAVKAGA